MTLKKNTPYYKQVRDLFDKDFFNILKEYIFRNDCYTYFNNYLSEHNTTINDIMYTINDPNYQDDLPNYEEIEITSFNDFLEYLENDSCYSFEMHLRILTILYNLSKLKEKNTQNSYYQITLDSEKIISDFYNREILNKLSNTFVNSLYSDYIDQNSFVLFDNEDNINIIKNKIIIFVLNYISTYIKTIVDEFDNDTTFLFQIYKYESKLKLNNNSNSEHLSKDIINEIKKLKWSKYKKSKGRKSREFLNIDFNELNYVKSEAEEALKMYKKTVKDIILHNDPIVANKKFKLFIQDMTYVESNVLSIYYDEYTKNNQAESKLCIYKFIDQEYSMNFFSKENSEDMTSFKNMEKWFKRHRNL